MNKRIVKIVRRSVKYNPHINNVGEVACVEEEGKDYLQVITSNGGVGAVDKDVVVDMDFELLSTETRIALREWCR